MPKKDYSDDFFYEYTPKHLKEELDPDREISSYSRTSVKSDDDTEEKKRPAAKKAPERRKTTGSKTSPARRTTASKPNLYLQAGGKFAKGVINKYGEICMVGLGTIIKVIAFIVAFALIIASLALGIMLFSSRSGLSGMSLLIIIAGVVIGAIFFFPIYGIGHIICQNNEILRIFTEGTDKEK